MNIHKIINFCVWLKHTFRCVNKPDVLSCATIILNLVHYYISVRNYEYSLNSE